MNKTFYIYQDFRYEHLFASSKLSGFLGQMAKKADHVGLTDIGRTNKETVNTSKKQKAFHEGQTDIMLEIYNCTIIK